MDLDACLQALHDRGYLVEEDVRPHRLTRHWMVFDPPDRPHPNDGWPDFFDDVHLIQWVSEHLVKTH